jgi:hypothetical protein
MSVIAAGLFVSSHVNHDFVTEQTLKKLKIDHKESSTKLSKLEKISKKIAKENEELITKSTKLHKTLYSEKDRFVAYIAINVILPRVYLDIGKTKKTGLSLGLDSCKKITMFHQTAAKFVGLKYKEGYFNPEQYELLMNIIIHEVVMIQKECNQALKGTI